MTIAIIGLGYVGLPLALELGKKNRIICFDTNEKKISQLKTGIAPSSDFDSDFNKNQSLHFTCNPNDLKQATFFIIAVPTEVDEHKIPDLNPLILASEFVGTVLKKGDIVVYESTTYPGCTEEDCLPILEHFSNLKLGADFGLGYSPERINPGDQARTVRSIPKIISGDSKETLDKIEAVYSQVVDAGLYRAPSIKVAEAAKVIENTQRDLNISFMNELSMLFDKLNIDTQEVLKAAATKWNFLHFTPGLVGGHCISVDPYYLLHKAKQVGYEPEVILSGRRVNDLMPLHIGRKIAHTLTTQNKNLVECRSLVLGLTFKENVTDIRNSKVFDLIEELQYFGIKSDVCDPFANSDEVKKRKGISLKKQAEGIYDVIILAVAHTEYANLRLDFFKKHAHKNAIIYDIKSMFNPEDFKDFTYFRL